MSEAASGGLMGVIGGNMLAERYVNTEDLKYFVRLVKWKILLTMIYGRCRERLFKRVSVTYLDKKKSFRNVNCYNIEDTFLLF